MQRYLKLTNQLVRKFDRVEFAQVSWDQNAKANKMARNVSTDNQAKVTGWKSEEQNYPSIKEFQTFPMTPTQNGRAQSYPILGMDDYCRILTKPSRSKNEQPGSRC